MDDVTAEIQIENNKDLWDEIGFHKPLAGFWYNLVYTIIAIILSSTLIGYLMNFFYPFPESFGYKDIANNVYQLVFVVFDIGTSAVMGRFIPEVNIKNPEKMLHYIQYFIWYQMITGLIQVTSISIYALFFVSESQLAYTVWLMLIISLTQFPGFLGVFKNVLDALQQYNKTQTLTFLTSTIFQRITELGFVFLGRLYGEANPEVGPILGIAIGAVIGLYVDDFGASMLAAYFFSKIMKDYGVKARDCFRIEFTWAEIKPVLIFSVKVSIPSIISSGLTLINLALWLNYVPQYTTLVVLSTIGGSLADIMDWFGKPSIGPLVAESYLNEKRKLAQFYLGQLFRFFWLIQGFFIPLVLLLNMVMPIAWVEFGMVNYLLATFFIIPRLVEVIFIRFRDIPGQIINNTGHENFGVIMGIINNILNTVFLYVFLVVLELGKIDIMTFAWLKHAGLIPIQSIFMFINYWYVHTKITKIKIPIKQIFFGMVIPCVIVYLFMLAIKFLIFDPLLNSYGFFIALFPSVLAIFFVLFFGYFPLTVYMGGWDDTNIEEFRKVSKMSGPSKIIVKPMYNLLEKMAKRSKLHNKYRMPIEGVRQEAEELLELKKTNRLVLREKLENT